MSKKINNEKAINATTEYNMNLQSYFTMYPNASIRKLAAATNINYGIMLKKSKEPVVGETYDPERINWKALEEKLTAKGIDWNKLDWDEMNSERSHKGATLCKDMEQFEVGKKVYLRKNNDVPYEIVYKTDTHIVIMLEGSSEPLAWSHNTFLINGPVFERRATKTEEVEEA